MKKILIIFFIFLFQINLSFASEKLLKPNVNDDFLKILLNRKTTREFSTNKEINIQTLSNILWSANGINRKDGSNKRTIPTALNKQNLNVYVIKRDGTFLYIPEKHELKEITKNNLFVYFENQDFVKNSNLVLLYTTKDFTEGSSYMEAGSAYQNVAIYCAEHNINNVVKGSFNRKDISKELKIKEKNILVAQVVGI